MSKVIFDRLLISFLAFCDQDLVKICWFGELQQFSINRHALNSALVFLLLVESFLESNNGASS